jgi:hypothetical protein
MRQENRWWFVFALIFVISLDGCGSSGQSSGLSLLDNSRLMDLYSTYTHCHRGEDLDAMRADAQRLSGAANTIDSAVDPIPLESREPVHSGLIGRLSVDPAEMAASCTLHTGQVAQEMGRLYVAREMFHMVVITYSQPRYQYYAAQARLGLEQLDAASRATL